LDKWGERGGTNAAKKGKKNLFPLPLCAYRTKMANSALKTTLFAFFLTGH
jgi:hypothetical protein